MTNANLRRVRKCPECDSKNWSREMCYGIITKSENGKITQSRLRPIDAMGSFTCLDCGFKEGL